MRNRTAGGKKRPSKRIFSFENESVLFTHYSVYFTHHLPKITTDQNLLCAGTSSALELEYRKDRVLTSDTIR